MTDHDVWVGSRDQAVPRESPAQNIGPFSAFFCMFSCSEQGLPLDSWDWETPLTLFTLGLHMKIGGSHDPTVPRETPALNNEGNLTQSRAPPGTATRSTPPYLYSKAALTIKHLQGLIASNRIMDRRFPSVLLKISYPSFLKIFIYPFKLKFTLFWSKYFFT